jgi:hypothetical protein
MATIADLVPSVTKLLGNRSDVANLAPEKMGEAIKELSNNYPFEELRITGPTVQLTQRVNKYSPSFFQAATSGTNPYTFNKVVSWFLYLQTPSALTGTGVGTANPGYQLKFKDIEDLEVLANTLTLPMFWSQLGSYLYLAGVPNRAYSTYLRYQWLHPFTNPIAAGTDTIYLPDTWYDIIEMSTAERIALELRMSDVADRFHVKLFGDPKHPGTPGLIAQRVSQTQKNQSRSTRSIRIVGR